MLRKWGLSLFSILFGIVLAILASTPPVPRSADTPAGEFSSARAMEDIRIIASAPHPTGSEENAKVRAYLSDRLTELGFEVSISESEITGRPLERLNTWSGKDKTSQTIYNIIGVLPGRDRTKKAVLLMAHHDTVWGSPGASDDTIGIASILEIARAVKIDGQPSRDLIVLFTDAEEVGLSGARHFFKAHPFRDRIGAIINFEARGGGGLATMFQTSADNGNVAKLYARSVSQPATSSLSVFVYNVLPNDTDLTPALEKDYVAYNIAHLGRAGYYHSPRITPDALGENTLQHMGLQGLDLARALLSSEALPEPSHDVVFFDVFGFFTVLYAPIWGWLILLVAILFYGFSVRGNVRLRQIGAGAFRMISYVLGGALALYLLNLISGAGGGADYYDRLAAITKLEYVALFLSVSVAVLLFGAKPMSVNERVGAALPFFALAIIGQALAPTAIYFISLALLFGGCASWMSRGETRAMVYKVLSVIIVAMVVGYMLGLGHLLMLGVGADMLSVAILPAAIVVLTLAPVYAGLTRAQSRYVALALFIAGVLIALLVRFDPVASTVPLY